MTKFAFEKWDDGRVTVNAAYAPSLRAGGLTSFDDFMRHSTGEIAKNLLKERTTVRLSLPGIDGGETDYFLKRHRNTPWREYVKPWLRLTWPIVGARNEWNAILAFHRAGIATMTPVAFGERRRESFLLTEGIANCRKLSDWMQLRFDAAHAMPDSHMGSGPLRRLTSRIGTVECCGGWNRPEKGPDPCGAGDADVRGIVDEIADLARRMHSHGLHHQDFYLTHLLLPIDDRARGIHVIDLGRARMRRRLSRRWIVKDLAQLNYSAALFPDDSRRRFLERYLGRRLSGADRGFVRQIECKTARIARHSAKHGL